MRNRVMYVFFQWKRKGLVNWVSLNAFTKASLHRYLSVVSPFKYESLRFNFIVLYIVKCAQNQHGLRHGDYQRYQQYVTRKLRRMRKSLRLQQGVRSRVVPKKLTPEIVNEARHLILAVFEIERSWAFAMQLKAEANSEPRKRFHMISRLRKAAKRAQVLSDLIAAVPACGAQTKLEITAYIQWIYGILYFELQVRSFVISVSVLSETVAPTAKKINIPSLFKSNKSSSCRIGARRRSSLKHPSKSTLAWRSQSMKISSPSTRPASTTCCHRFATATTALAIPPQSRISGRCVLVPRVLLPRNSWMSYSNRCRQCSRVLSPRSPGLELKFPWNLRRHASPFLLFR